MNRTRTLLVAVFLTLLPHSAFAQRFGGQVGAGGGFWLLYMVPNIESDQSFGRDLGDVVTLGARAFVQFERVRLGGGGFGGGFTSEGLNASGNEVTGGVSGGGFTAEYLALRQNLEIAFGGFAGGGVVTVEERQSIIGDEETLKRRRDTIFIGLPWVRLGYNPAPFVNVGLQLGYFIGTRDFDGFTVGLDVMVGLIP